jgi:hypothetical protein
MARRQSVLQAMAERVAARGLGVEVSELREVLANKESSQLIGFNGFDIWDLVAQILEVLLANIGNCQSRPAVFNAMRRPGLFATGFTNNRTREIFRDGNPMWIPYSRLVADGIRQEASTLSDEDFVKGFQEAHNPDPDYVIF